MHYPSRRKVGVALAGFVITGLFVLLEARSAAGQTADLAVFKTDLSESIVVAGTDLSYLLTMVNFGPDSASSVTLTDVLPANTTFVSFTQTAGLAFTVATPAVGGTGTVTATIASLAAGDGATFMLVVHVSAGTPDLSAISNTASGTSGTLDPNPQNDSETVTTTVVTQADLSATKTDAPDPVVPGTNLAYTLTVTNAGPSDAENVTLTDALPANTTFLSFTQTSGPAFTLTTPAPGGTGTVTAAIASLANGATATFMLVVHVSAGAPNGGTISNTASVTSTTTDPNGADNDATATTTAVKLLATAAGPGGGPHVRGFEPTGAPTPTGFLAYGAGFAGGVFVAVGDLSGGGPAQIVTGAGPGGGPHVRVFEPDNTDAGIGFFAYDPTFAGGVRVAVGDVDGDGRAEIITAAGPGGGPHVRVWTVTGTTPTPSADVFAYPVAFAGGVFVAAGDLDGDGRAEIVTGAGEGGGPHVRVWRVTGATMTELFGFFAYDPAFTGGVRVAVGDVNGDGKADVITGAGPGGGPHVRVFDGAQLLAGHVVELKSFFAYDGSFTGGVYVAAGDVNGDGKADLVTGAGPGGGPHVRVFDGLTLAGIGSFFAYDLSFTGGVAVGVGP